MYSPGFIGQEERTHVVFALRELLDLRQRLFARPAREPVLSNEPRSRQRNRQRWRAQHAIHHRVVPISAAA